MLKIQSYILFACYLLAAIVVWFVFYHHPSHIGIKIRESKTNEENVGFNEDTTNTIWNPLSTNAGRNINSTVHRVLQHKQLDEPITGDLRSLCLDVAENKKMFSNLLTVHFDNLPGMGVPRCQ